jgi:fimbrial chaperone protein
MHMSYFKLRAVRARGFFVSLGLMVLCSHAIAGGFQVSPTIAEVPAGTRVTSFELRNNGAEPVTVQVDLLAWAQTTGDSEQLTPATGVVVVPRIATMPAHGSQLVRIAIQAPQEHEQSFRLRLREVPPPPPAGFMGVRTLVQQLVPVFFLGSGEASVTWRASLQSQNTIMLVATNTGKRHLATHAIRLVDDRGGVLAERKGPGYVLAGESVGWPLETHAHLAHGDVVKLQFLSQGTQRDVAITIE